ncbi:MAG: DJ-1 family protein [Gammaproteobacteria bacterium]|nr:MAG: DJ-1 family protein [Gammaproteobacteria bacterium]
MAAPRVLVPLAEGFEELEAVTIIDLLRRAGVEVVSAGLQPGPVRGSRGTVILPDDVLDNVIQQEFDMIALPGGLPGADHLNNDPRLRQKLQDMARNNRTVAAICAAPKVLASAGLLNGRKATSYTGALDDAAGVELLNEPVVADGNIVTSRGPGTAMDFALALIEQLLGPEKRMEVETPLLRPQSAPAAKRPPS